MLLALLPALAFAQAGSPTPPSPDELKRAIDYYYSGRGEPVLVELVPCLKVDTRLDSPGKNECVQRVDGPVPRHTNVMAWTLWFVPERPDAGAPEDYAIVFAHEGTPRTTIDLALTPSFRTRTYRASTLSRPGKWEIRILRNGKEVAKAPVTVL